MVSSAGRTLTGGRRSRRRGAVVRDARSHPGGLANGGWCRSVGRAIASWGGSTRRARSPERARGSTRDRETDAPPLSRLPRCPSAVVRASIGPNAS